MNTSFGFCADTIEFKSTPQGLMVFENGTMHRWDNAPEEITDLVLRDMCEHPEAMEALQHLLPTERLRTYATCKWGGSSEVNPDLTRSGASYSEHWACNCTDCPLRHVLRGKLKVAHGHLSEREIEIAKLIALGYLGKEINDKLGIAESTFNTHKHHIFGKVGVQSSVQLAVWAKSIHLI